MWNAGHARPQMKVKKEKWSFRLDTPSNWSWIRFWIVLGCTLPTILQNYFRIEPTQFLKSTHEFPICTMYSIRGLIVFQVSDKYFWISLKLDPCVPQGDRDYWKDSKVSREATYQSTVYWSLNLWSYMVLKGTSRHLRARWRSAMEFINWCSSTT
jgi:hypothetical protein